MNMDNTTYNSTEDMTNKLQSLKGKTKLKFYKNLSNYYDKTNIKMDEDLFAKLAQGSSKMYQEVFLLKNFYRLSQRLRI